MQAILVVCSVFLYGFGGMPACGQTGDLSVESHGFIVYRSGETLTMRTVDAGDVLVVLNEITRVLTAAAGSRATQTSVTTLVPGMILKVQGVRSDDGQLIAKTVELAGPNPDSGEARGAPPTGGNPDQNNSERTTYDQPLGAAGDQSVAGEGPPGTLQQQIQDARHRFEDLSDYVIKGTVDVYFAAGSAAIAPHYKDKLFALAQRAGKLRSYLIQIHGFATSGGTAPEKPELSQERVQAVIVYLEQIANVPLTHMAACGNGAPNAPPLKEISHDSTDERRAEIRLLVTRTGNGAKNR